MPLTVAQLVARLSADTSGFYKSMAIANSAMVRTGGILSRGFAAAGIATTAFGFLSLRAAGNFQQSMNLVQAVLQPTTAQMNQLRQRSIDLGRDLRLPAVSAKDAADVMYDLGRAGLSVNQVLTASRGVLLLGTAANVSFGDAALVVARALKAFNLPGSDATRIANELAAATNKSTASFDDMVQGMQNASGQFQSAGYSMETMNTALTELIDKGLQGSMAGTALKTMLQRLESPTKKAAALMKEYGIEVFDAHGKMLPLRTIIAEFEVALRGASDEQKNQTLNTIFGMRANQAMVKLMEGGVQAWDAYEKKITSANTAQQLADARMKGFNGSMQAFENAVSTLAIELGTALLPSMTRLTRSMASFIADLDPNKIIQFFATLIAPIKWIAQLIAGTASLRGMVIALVAAFVAYRVAVAAAAIATKIFMAASATNPLMAGFYAAAAVIGLVVGWLTRAGNEMNVFGDAAKTAKASIDALQGSLTTLTDAHLSLSRARITLAQAQAEETDAEKEWQQVSKSSTATAVDKRNAWLRLISAHQSVKESINQVRGAEEASTKADKERASALRGLVGWYEQTRSGVMKVAQAYQQGNISGAEASKNYERLYPILVKHIEANIKQAKSLADTDRQGSKANATAALYGKALLNILSTTNKMPTKKVIQAEMKRIGFEEFYAEITKLPKSSKKAGDDSSNELGVGLDKMKPKAVLKVGQAILAAGTAGATAGRREGGKAGRATGQSIADGITSKTPAIATAAYNAVFGAINAAGAALHGSGPWQFTRLHGRTMAEALINGFEAYMQENGMKAAEATRRAAETTKAVLPAIQAAGRILGMGHAMAIVNGIIEGTPSLKQQIKQALTDATQEAIKAARQKVIDARADFSSAWSDLASAALAAFDAQVAKWESPTRKILEKMQLADTIKQMTEGMDPAIQALETKLVAAIEAGLSPAAFKKKMAELQAALKEEIAKLQGAVDSAQAEYDAAVASGDPEAIQKAKEKLDAAQQQLKDALQKQRELIEYNLGLQAEAEEKAHAKLMEKKRAQFEAKLKALEKSLLKEHATAGEAQDKILRLLKKYIPDFKLSGKALGDAIAAGLREAIDNVEEAAKDLAAAIKKYLKLSSPAEVGPLSDLDHWWDNFAPTLLTGFSVGDIEKGIQDRLKFGLHLGGGLAIPGAPAAGALSMGGGGYVTYKVELHNPTFVGTNLDTVADELWEPLRRRGLRYDLRQKGA